MWNVLKLCFTFLFISKIAFAQTAQSNFILQVTQTSDYCGGAAPPQFLLDELATPKPMPMHTLYIVKGNTNKKGIAIYKKIITNGDGKVALNLPKGTYAILNATQIKAFKKNINDKYHTWDNTCLLKKWKQPLLVVTINKNFNSTINIHNNCSYTPDCCQYSGPLPP